MQPSIFNVRVPLPARNEVFLMNTLTDAQLMVSPEVTDLLDRFAGEGTLQRDQRRRARGDDAAGGERLPGAESRGGSDRARQVLLVGQERHRTS